MNIFFYENITLKNISNASVHIYEILNGLTQLGHNVVLINGESFVWGQEDSSDGQPSEPSLWARLENKLNWFRIFRPLRGEITILWLLLREVWTFLLALVTIVRWRGGLDVIYRRHVRFNSAYLLSKLFGIPSVKEVNGIGVDEMKITKQGDKLSLWIVNIIEQFSMPRADKVIVVTSRLKEVLQEDFGVPDDKVVVIPNGANINLFRPTDTAEARSALGLDQSNYYVCFVGNLVVWLGIDNLIRSVGLVIKRCPQTSFLIIGDGSIKQELRELADQLNVGDKVIFTGMVSHSKIPLYLNASDLCVVPAAENFRNNRTGGSPLKLYEYMACGKPVVVGNIPGVREMVEESRFGIVVDSTDKVAMSRAIVTLLTDAQLRKEMGERGRKAVVEKYSWESVAGRVADVCKSVMKKG
jgi:glycosyltransferase involved in cell wall biosynthesis